MFKIRGSYGEVGNDELDGRRFPYITLVDKDESGSYAFGEFAQIQYWVIVLRLWEPPI